MKGFFTSPDWSAYKYQEAATMTVAPMDYYYIPLNEVMTDSNTFDWERLETRLNQTKA